MVTQIRSHVNNCPEKCEFFKKQREREGKNKNQKADTSNNPLYKVCTNK